MEDFKSKIVYQVWPRSFQDSNGDGIGDIPGIISRLDHIAGLGVDLVWLSPIYASGNRDYGYDVDDYRSINAEYGTMRDFERLVAEADGRGLGILMDLVVGHSSDRHEWFRQALADRHSPYRGFYFFRDGKPDGGPPNNWLSAFGGSAWQRDPASGQYYLTMFTPHQCDLDWSDGNLRSEIHSVMRFWLDKGVAGFRFDVVNTIAKAEGLPDAGDPRRLEFPREHIVSLPRSHDHLREMREKATGHRGYAAIGEGLLASPVEASLYTDPSRRELDAMLHFDLHDLGCGPLGKYDFRKLYRWTTRELKETVFAWQETVQERNGWIANDLSNHDHVRQVSWFGDDGRRRVESAKALALLNLTLRGTPIVYQGEEIGMTDCPLEKDEWRDFEAINAYGLLQSFMHLPAFLARKIVRKMTRDNARTPMQWDSGVHAGFSTAAPWIKLNPNHATINVEDDEANPDSILAFYRALIKLRKAHPALSLGDFKPLYRKHRTIVAYTRRSGAQVLLVMVNLSPRKARFKPDLAPSERHPLLLRTHPGATRRCVMEPYEGRIYVLHD